MRRSRLEGLRVAARMDRLLVVSAAVPDVRHGLAGGRRVTDVFHGLGGVF